MSHLRFDGKVVVVTGAGAGLGRAYALLFGSRGASVVVNDLGGGRHGEGNSTKAADVVVNEITSAGGKAVADYNSVVDGDKIIRTALENFGRVDVVVNNAGILRDKSFASISDADWNMIHDVHLKGSFKTSQAAWPYFKKQKFGRIIMTSSNSGIYGNFGQANYSAAKMGLIGLCNTIAIEGQRYNINCNVIVPTAASRLTEDILPPDLFAELKPELIAPVVVWLCHENCEETGGIIESAAGWATKYAICRGEGCPLRQKLTDSVTPEAVRDKWSKITDMGTKEHLTSIQEASLSLVNKLDEMRGVPADEDDAESSSEFVMSDHHCILYSLGIGASTKNKSELKFLYEGHEEFSAFPTHAIIPGLMAVMSSEAVSNAIPGKSFDLSQVLHGEQYLEMFKTLPTNGKLYSLFKIADVLDKGKNAVIIADVTTYGEDREPICNAHVSTIVVGGGGFGGKRTSDKTINCVDPPSREPDAVVTEATSFDQAALYRLSGDLNPLHIDPNFAFIGGYKRPILHGLCSLGFSVRHVLNKFAGSNPESFKALKVRFTKPVYPGETLKTEMWKNGDRIHFRTSVVETGDIVISGAYVDLSGMDNVSEVLNSHPLASDSIFQILGEKVMSDKSILKKVNGVFVYQILNNGTSAKQWTVDLKNGLVYEGPPKDGLKTDTTLIIEDQDMVDMAVGKLNPQAAFMKGKLKVKGNLMLVQKLKPLLAESKL